MGSQDYLKVPISPNLQKLKVTEGFARRKLAIDRIYSDPAKVAS